MVILLTYFFHFSLRVNLFAPYQPYNIHLYGVKENVAMQYHAFLRMLARSAMYLFYNALFTKRK